MNSHPPRSTRTDPLCPDPTLFRSRAPTAPPGFSVSIASFSGATALKARGPVWGFLLLRLIAGARMSAPDGGGQWNGPYGPFLFGWVTSAAWVTCGRSEEHTSELQSLMRSSYGVFCLTKKNNQ